MKKIILTLFLTLATITYMEAKQAYEYGHDYSESCVIKGNISYNGGKKFYFLSSHRNYAEVRINKTGERCFATEAEARKAGWVKALE